MKKFSSIFSVTPPYQELWYLQLFTCQNLEKLMEQIYQQFFHCKMPSYSKLDAQKDAFGLDLVYARILPSCSQVPYPSLCPQKFWLEGRTFGLVSIPAGCNRGYY